MTTVTKQKPNKLNATDIISIKTKVMPNVPVNTEKGFGFYNDRYKYGYEWSAYAKLSEEIINYMNIENGDILIANNGQIFRLLIDNTKLFQISDFWVHR